MAVGKHLVDSLLAGTDGGIGDYAIKLPVYGRKPIAVEKGPFDAILLRDLMTPIKRPLVDIRKGDLAVRIAQRHAHTHRPPAAAQVQDAPGQAIRQRIQ